MDILHTLILTIHVLAAIGVVGLVLLQHGKGADMGAAFGSGASGSLFGARGSANFLSRSTAVLAAVTSLALSYIATSAPRVSGSVMDAAPAPVAPATAPEPAAAPDSKAKEIPK